MRVVNKHWIGMLRRLVTFIAVCLATFSLSTPANAAGPTNTALPTISGNLVSGQILAVTAGNWDSTPSSLLYQWFKCSSDAVSSCSSINAATGTSYLISASDIGSRFQVSVTALTSGGGTTAVSPMSGVAITLATATSLPLVSGEAGRGSTLTTTQGSWNVNVVVSTYQWQRCTSNEVISCTPISGAIGVSYMTVVEDVGRYVRSTVTLPEVGSYGAGTST